MCDGDFESFYVSWYARARRFAQTFVVSQDEAENIVQDVFLSLYESHDLADARFNAIAYLFASLKNRCLDSLRHDLRRRHTVAHMHDEIVLQERLRRDTLEAFDTVFDDEDSIVTRLRQALDRLPERCRQVFVMSKIDGKRQKDIAAELGISVNTVESQMAMAYRRLRDELRGCLPLLLLLV